jgi:hypothetical protein
MAGSEATREDVAWKGLGPARAERAPMAESERQHYTWAWEHGFCTHLL